MPRDNLPPLTTKKAKRLHQKSGKHFQFTASQFRAAERREELDERRKKEEAREQRRRDNKRKRDEREDREREAKRRQLSEGKLQLEETWGKVGASQPRLNTFFKRPALPSPKEPEQPEGEKTCEIPEHGPQEDTFVEQQAGALGPPEKVSEAQLTEKMPQTETKNRLPSSPSIDLEQNLLDAQLSFSQSFWDFVIAEDETADQNLPGQQPEIEHHSLTPTRPHKLCTSPTCAVRAAPPTPSPLKRKPQDSLDLSLSSPSKTARSALSEMSPSKVNVRAQEKPDVTSTPKGGSSLPSPEKERQKSAETPADFLALVGTQELDDEDFLNDKENEDPWQAGSIARPTSQKSEQPRKDFKKTTAILQRKQPPPPGFGDLSDCEDLFDFDLDSELDDFDDEGLDDSVFAAMSTQMPAKNTAVTSQGSPKKAKSSGLPKRQSALSRPLMLPPPLPRPAKDFRSTRPFTKSNSNSFAFDGVDDEDLTDLVDLLDSDTTKTATPASEPMKRGRMIPWLHPSQYPPPEDCSQGDADTLTSSPEVERE